MIRIAIVLTWLAATAGSVSAQSGSSLFERSSRSAVGGVGPSIPSSDRLIGASSDSEILRHRGPTGSPCLTVGGLARPHAANPKVYDHVIAAKNSCAQRITLTVCYYRSQDCVPMEVPGGERKEAVLGTLPSMPNFRFEFREKF